jgi:hypothetical protein
MPAEFPVVVCGRRRSLLPADPRLEPQTLAGAMVMAGAVLHDRWSHAAEVRSDIACCIERASIPLAEAALRPAGEEP